MEEILKITGALLGVVISVIFLIGLAVKFVLLPWLEKNLVKPVKETNNQVSQNTHVSIPPTMLDTVHEVKDKVESLEETLQAVVKELATQTAFTKAIGDMWGHHLEWSTDEVARIWAAIRRRELRKVKADGKNE